MTGEQLYDLYAIAMHKQGVDTQRWAAVPFAEKQAWEAFAAVLVTR